MENPRVGDIFCRTTRIQEPEAGFLPWQVESNQVQGCYCTDKSFRELAFLPYTSGYVRDLALTERPIRGEVDLARLSAISNHIFGPTSGLS